MHGFGCLLSELGGGPLAAGGTNRFDPCHASGVRAFDTFTAGYRGNHLCRDEYDNVLDIPCNMEVFGLEVRCENPTGPNYNH